MNTNSWANWNEQASCMKQGPIQIGLSVHIITVFPSEIILVCEDVVLQGKLIVIPENTSSLHHTNQ
jgi:hypothetical protein